jgi:uncharacterized membrane protein
MTIETPQGWLWSRVSRSAGTVGAASPDEYWGRTRALSSTPVIRHIGTADLRAALTSGMADFAANRTEVIFLCVVYPVIGLLLGRVASGQGLFPLLFPLAAGFTLIGPFAAVGLNEMSRRRERGEPSSWVTTFGVLRSPAIGGIALLGLLLIGLFLMWMVAASAIYNVTLGPRPPVSLEAFAHDVFSTGAGWAMIVLGMTVGFLFAAVVLAISLVSFPLLLDRNVAIDTAISTSVRAVLANPGPVALWGLIVAVSLVLGSIPLFVGLVVVLPVLGHATWHLYRRIVVN